MINWKETLYRNKWILLMLIPIVLTLFVRLETMRLVPLEGSAEATVKNYYVSQIINDISRQYPSLSDAKKRETAEKKWNEFASDKKIQQDIEKAKEDIKSRFQYEVAGSKYVYLGDIDSYYWLRQSRNILEKGTQCDIVKDGRCYDSYTIAPNILEKAYDYYPIAIVAVYKFLRIFNPNMPLMQASFLTPLIFSLLTIIPLFLLLRKIGGNYTAVLGTIFVSVNPYVLSRTLGSDSDINNVFFQALFFWLAVECFYAEKKKKYIWSALAALSLLLYSFFWAGWWYLADIFIAALFVRAAYLCLKEWLANKKINLTPLNASLKETLIAIAVFIGILAVLYPVIYSFGELLNIIASHITIVRFKVAANPNYWPNVLTTVAEFNSMGLSSIVSSFGSFYNMPIFLMAILGSLFFVFPTLKFITKNLAAFFILLGFDILLYFIIKSSSSPIVVFLILLPVLVGIYLHSKSDDFIPEPVFFFSLMVCLVTYFTTIGVRFLFIMAIPVSILVAVFIVKLSSSLLKLVKIMLKNLNLDLPDIVVAAVMICILVIFLFPEVKAGQQTAQSYLPYVTDEWVAALEKIKYGSREDAIINSWWDFGHWFKYYADRRVTLDGSSQNSPQLHWLGKLLLTDDEKTCVGILRMLDCGGNKAFDAVNEAMNDTPHSVDILNKIIVQKKSDAEIILKEHGFSSSQLKKVLNYTHCNAPENFLITSQDMIGKSGVWAHFGSWDFKRSYLSSAYSKIPQDELIKKFEEDYGINKEQVNSLLSEISSLSSDEEINAWIAPWPGYLMANVPCSYKNNITECVFSQSGNAMPFTVDFERKEAYLVKPDGERVFIKRAAFVTENSFEMKEHSGETAELGIVVEKNGDKAYAYFMGHQLTGSMFTRLFFFEGKGLSSFEKFYDTTSAYGDRIIVWKVKWPQID